MTFGHTSVYRIEHTVVFKYCLSDRVIFRFQIASYLTELWVLWTPFVHWDTL